jgi:hypothetical protein
MGIRSWFKKFLTPMKKPSAVAREASGEIRVGKSAYAIASRRWKLYKHNAALRMAGIIARHGNKHMCPDSWFRPITNRKTPKPCSYSNPGAGRVRAIRREQQAVANGKGAKKKAA